MKEYCCEWDQSIKNNPKPRTSFKKCQVRWIFWLSQCRSVLLLNVDEKKNDLIDFFIISITLVKKKLKSEYQKWRNCTSSWHSMSLLHCSWIWGIARFFKNQNIFLSTRRQNNTGCNKNQTKTKTKQFHFHFKKYLPHCSEQKNQQQIRWKPK